MNPEVTAVPKGDNLPPSVVGGCFDPDTNRMWLAFEDQTAAFYPRVPKNVMRRLQTFEGPTPEANEYLRTHVHGVLESRPVDYMAVAIASTIGLEPPTD